MESMATGPVKVIASLAPQGSFSCKLILLLLFGLILAIRDRARRLKAKAWVNSK
jgi:hypothetical protein